MTMTTSSRFNGTRTRDRRLLALCLAVCALACLADAKAAGIPQSRPEPGTANAEAGYRIGPTDVLSVVFWGEKDLTTDVVVRPDGKISLPLLQDVVAAGLTPEELRQDIAARAKKYLEAPSVTVIVKQVNNNLAFVTGQVARPGSYVLTGTTTVLHVLAMAGGFTEFADTKHILITRFERGAQLTFAFNYDDVVKRRDLSQNLILKAGDTVVVP